MKRIGYFGGTFDPIHNGHLKLAKTVMDKMFLDAVVFIPSGESYQKTNVTSAKYRVGMIQGAIASYPTFYCMLMDVKREGPTYTIDTVDYIMHHCIDDDDYETTPYWIMGADAFLNIKTYKDYEEILRTINIIIVDRGNKWEEIKKLTDELRREQYCEGFDYVTFNDNTSSTEIRELISQGKINEANIPANVRDYILANELYNSFDGHAAAQYIVNWICNKMNGFNENSKAVIGISGGKDSTVMAALCVRALGKDRVIGVLLPHGVQKDIDDSYKVCRHLDIQHYNINIGCAYDEMLHEVNTRVKPSTTACEINLAPRIRMAYLYAVAQTIGNAFVINTCNLSEDWVGYSTWHGDSAGDFSPLAKYTSEEVVAIGDALGLPHDLTHKTPADGLCGKTDEDNLGFTYHELNEYIRGRGEPAPEIKALIDKKHKANLFKLQPLDTCPYYKGEEK